MGWNNNLRLGWIFCKEGYTIQVLTTRRGESLSPLELGPSKFPQKKASRVDREKFVWQGFKDSLKGHKKGPPYLDDDAI